MLAVLPVEGQTSAYAEAETLVRAGQFDQSIVLIEEILRTNPSNLKALNLLGIALSGKGDLDAANRHYRKALELDPTFVPAPKNLAINELAQKNVAAAKRDLTTALKLAPSDSSAHGYLGKIAYAQHEYATAAAHLGHADVAGDPRFRLRSTSSRSDSATIPIRIGWFFSEASSTP